MKTSRFARRVICLTAASALLLQSAAPAYAAPKPSKELDAKLNRAIEAASARRPATAREFCARLSVCADEMNEAVLFTPYMPAQSAASFEAGDWYGALSKEETAAFFSLFDQARAAYAKAAFLSEEQFEFLLRVFPSFAAAVPFSRNEKARRALEQIYLQFFKELRARYKNPAAIEKAPQAAQSAVAAASVYASLGFPAQRLPQDVTAFLSAAATTSLAPYAVAVLTESALAMDDYATLKSFILAASCAEADCNPSVLKAFDLFTFSHLVADADALKTNYSGPVSRYGFYVISGSGDSAVMGNVWEDLPGIILSADPARGAQLLNEIFYDGIACFQTSSHAFEPTMEWKNGALTPFLIGAVASNQIRPRDGAGKSCASLARYYSANLTGLAEIYLLKHKFYDLNDATYRRVRNLLVYPYAKAVNDSLYENFKSSPLMRKYLETYYGSNNISNVKIPVDAKAVPAGERYNFDVIRHTDGAMALADEYQRANPYVGMLYTPFYKTGKYGTPLLVNETPQQRQVNKQLWGEISSAMGAADTVIGVALTMQAVWALSQVGVSLGAFLRSLPQRVRNMRGVAGGADTAKMAAQIAKKRNFVPALRAKIKRLTGGARTEARTAAAQTAKRAGTPNAAPAAETARAEGTAARGAASSKAARTETKAASSAKPKTETAPKAAPKEEGSLSAASEEAVAKKLTGPLEEKVNAARASSPMKERGLMPKAAKDVKPGPAREDGLVYMEAHATDPDKVVFYYAQRSGVTAKEMTRAEYEVFVKTLSEADKAGLNRGAALFADEIRSARVNREYDRLESLGRQVKELRAKREAIAASGKTAKEDFAEVRRLDAQIKALEEQAGAVVKDISAETGGTEKTVYSIYESATQTAPSPRPARQKPLSMRERGLMPKAAKNAKSAGPRQDGLVYAEAHATDPDKVVLYYSDAAGSKVTAVETPRARYDAMVKAMSETDKASLQATANAMADEIKSARINREYDRLEALGRRVKELNARKAQIASAGKGSKEEMAQMRRLDAEIKAVEKQADGVIQDISREQGVSQRSIAHVYGNAAAPDVTPAKAAPAKPLSMNDRSLMPTVRENIKPGPAREDGLVYMEAHPTDPNKAVLYYADDAAGSRVSAREVTRAEYERLVQGMSDADKAALNKEAGALAGRIKSVRLEREYNRMERLGRRVKDLNAQKAEITSSGKASSTEMARVREIDRQIQLAEAEADGVIKDIAREQGSMQKTVRGIYEEAKQPAPAPKAAPKEGPVAMKDRGLMPSASDKIKVSSMREDGLVYMEVNGADSNRVVMYYAEGNKVTAREISRSQYEVMLEKMTAVEKKQLQNGARLYADEIRTVRINREYDRLDDLGAKLDKLDARLREIESLRKPTEYEFKQGFRLNKERSELVKEIENVIDDLSRESHVKKQTILETFMNSRAAEPVPAAPSKPLAMRERSLMPRVSQTAKPGEPRADGLVYMEAHPTNPDKAVFYYADEMGAKVTPKEVWRSEYDKLVSSMTEGDKASLARYASAMSKEIKTARINREYERLEDLGRRLEEITRRFETIKRPDYPVSWAHAEAAKLNPQKRALAKELEMVIKDLAREQGVSEASVRQFFQNSFPAAA